MKNPEKARKDGPMLALRGFDRIAQF